MWKYLLFITACGRISFDDRAVCTGAPVALDRASQWIPGNTAGSAAGNPSAGSAGTVWSYEWVSGGPLGAADAWYRAPSSPLVWDDDWFGQGGGWTFADNLPPLVTATELTQGLEWGQIGIMRLINVSENAVQLRASGVLQVRWRGFEGTTPTALPVAVDLVVARLRGDGSERAVHVATTIAKPTANSLPEDAGVAMPDAIELLEPGESLTISARPTATSMANVWITLGDDALALDVTPCR